ncbi:MAG: amino acid permease [Clostridiales bacterium]|jgi:arginine:ornithine antiporter/lysine permease|nr:amino acid permease [Clostridiales bacterium]
MEDEKKSKKLGLIPLVALIVGSSIGGGIFNATADIAGSAPAGIALLTWLIVGAGIMLLVLSLNNIIRKRPDLDGGLVQYAEEGFGKFWGLVSGWGYWLSAWLGNVAFAALLLYAIGGLLPSGSYWQNQFMFGEEATTAGIILPFMIVSIVMWGLVLLVTRGVQSAAFINTVVLIAKFVPLLLVLVMSFVAFKAGIFKSGFWDNVFAGGDDGITLWGSISGGFMTMIWCFVGVEGACMFGDKAKNQKSVAKATNIGFVLLLVVYLLLSIVPYGVLSQGDLADLSKPALGGVLQEAFGGSMAGVYIVNVGLIISLLGAWLSWTMLPVQTLEVMEKQGYISNHFAKKNKQGVPVFSLVVTTICAQVFMLLFLFPDFLIAGESPYNFFVYMCGNAIMVTWFFAAMYQIKLSLKDDNKASLVLNTVIGTLAAAFQVFMVLSVGGWLFMTMWITYIPAFGLYLAKRKKDVANTDEKLFSSLEILFMSIITIVAVISVVLVLTKAVDIFGLFL